MDAGQILAVGLAYSVVALFGFLARLTSTEDAIGSYASGILWPIYLPYRLLLIIRSMEP